MRVLPSCARALSRRHRVIRREVTRAALLQPVKVERAGRAVRRQRLSLARRRQAASGQRERAPEMTMALRLEARAFALWRR